MKVFDIIVVGGGPSGMSAALYALRSGKSVLILEKENFGGQISNSPRVENFPSIKEISGLDFTDNLFNQVTDLGAEFELEEVLKVEKLDNEFKVTTNYNEHHAKKVIIANGVSHRLMNLPNEDKFIGNGISFCAVCDGGFYKGQDVYLIGDGNTAVQYALLLSNTSKNVFVFTLFDKFFADKIIVERLKNTPNIYVNHNMSLVNYIGNEKLEGLEFENTVDKTHSKYNTNNVFVAIGQVPHNENYANLACFEKGYFIVDENMMTSTEGLYAVGDTRKKGIRQLVTACNDGAIAALHAVNNL